MKFAVIVFPGSNCDVDMYHAIKDALGKQIVEYVTLRDNLDQYDGILTSGGFSYGDYLRSGAIARFSNVMAEVNKAAQAESLSWVSAMVFRFYLKHGLLPGAMRRNEGLKFICRNVGLKVENNQSMFIDRI